MVPLRAIPSHMCALPSTCALQVEHNAYHIASLCCFPDKSEVKYLTKCPSSDFKIRVDGSATSFQVNLDFRAFV